MKHRIFYYKPYGNGPTTEVQKFSLFKNRAGYTTYNLEVSRFDLNHSTYSSWAGKAYDPEGEVWEEFPHRAHYTNFSIYNDYLPGLEKAFAVYLIAENEEEQSLVTNCQACVRYQPWSFQVCLIPDSDFFSPKEINLDSVSTEAKNLLAESLGLTLRPKDSDRAQVLAHSYEFLSKNYAAHVFGVGRVIHEADLESLVKELKNLS